jgi:uncharacterized protein (TIGR02453 family)
MPADLKITLDFLQEIRYNNTKAWFEANRASYDRARSIFEAFVGQIIAAWGQEEDLGPLTPKDCTYRFHRDTRFSADKSPYKTNFAALIAKGGRKPQGCAYFFSLEPNDCFVGGGTYMPTPQELTAIRHKIAADPQAWEAILQAEAFQTHYGKIEGEQLKKAPKGFDPAHPALQWLKYKQFYTMRRLTTEEVLGDDLLPTVVSAFRAARPLEEYLFPLQPSPSA